jgi:dipeptidyl aminopeptidase/acylaminoacyl peptidase
MIDVMKHNRTAAALTALLLAPLLLAQQSATGRIEQGNLIFDGIPTRDPAESTQLARWLESRSAGFIDWLSDGSLVIATRFGNTAQLHRVKSPLGMREQLTFEAEPVTSAMAHPYDANLLLYGKDRGGDENTQLWLHNLRDHSSQLLTDGKSLNGAPVFAHDGKRIAYYSNARDGASYDIYLRDIAAGALPQLLITGSGDAQEVQDWSLDDRRLAVIRYTSITNSKLLIADVTTGALTPVEPAADSKGGTVSVAEARFSLDGRGLFFLSDRGGEFMALHYYDLYSREIRTLTPNPQWDVERFALSHDARYIAYTRNEGGFDRLVLHDLTLQADVLLPQLPGGAVISSIGFDRKSQQLAVGMETAQSPADVFVYNIANAADASTAASVTLARWTQSERGPIDESKLSPALLVDFPTWDKVGTRQRTIPAFVYRPQKAGPHPVIIDIHGGPESQYRPQWSAFTQYLVSELGYAVVAPNVRGSAGYGRSFLKLDDAALREDSVRDIGALLVWIGLQPDLDRNRVVVMGGSYGGYMTLASLVNYSDRLAGGVDVVGISNFVTFLTNTSAYRRDLRRAEYGDERDPKMRALLQNISPLNNAQAIRKPLLIVQGLNDPRVPFTESEQMMAKVRAGGGEVWYLAAKDEGHGFRKKANRDVYLATVAQFLKRIAGH